MQAAAHRLAVLAAEVAQLRDERVRMAAMVQSAQAATRSQDEIHQSKIGAQPAAISLVPQSRHSILCMQGNSRALALTALFCNWHCAIITSLFPLAFD